VPAPRLADLARGRDNNLNLLRMLAATLVMYGHAFGVARQTEREPFFRLFGIGTGDVGVDAFFVISGFLIAKSFTRKPLPDFVWARIMRIYPGLWVSSLLLVIAVGLTCSPLPAFEFWRLPTTHTYLAKNATMLPGLGAQLTLPFAFDAVTTSFNDSLWTLPYELQMYMLLAAIGLCGLLRSARVVALLALCSGVIFGVERLGLFDVMQIDRARFIFLFFTGAAFYMLRESLPFRGWVALACVAVCLALGLLTTNHAIHRVALIAAMPYTVMWLGYVPRGPLRAYNRVGDYSYGTYILACPIQILLARHFPAWTPLHALVVALPVVLALALVSWHFLEAPALAVPVPTWLARLPRLNKKTAG
jgi:peptidoglycan/LPS O-acetylase OafA/YrhL